MADERKDAPPGVAAAWRRAALDAALDFLLRWQIGVETHVEDVWDEARRAWVPRPCFAWDAGSFPTDWSRGGAPDPADDVWRMRAGLTWHCGQTVRALCRAHAHLPSPRLERAIAEGSRFLLRMQILEGPNRGALWTPPHSLPPEWNAQSGGARLYINPWTWRPAGTVLYNSDMAESLAGWLAAADLLADRALLDGCRRWGEWFAREAEAGGGRMYHDFDTATGAKREHRYWKHMDDGVQGLLGARFGRQDWIELYLEKVRLALTVAIRLEDLPAQQGRTFYWNSSLLHPVVERRVAAPPEMFDRCVAKLSEYGEWILGLLSEEGMAAFRYIRPGEPDHEGEASGDGAATAMAARMCRLTPHPRPAGAAGGESFFLSATRAASRHPESMKIQALIAIRPAQRPAL